jgi:polyferredoxin/tetratricopeptide (TPR) repeat protein
MIAHVVQWLLMGSTTAPIEPSEGMAAVKDGIINAGGIFFAAALLSTAILGRWMCGWMCHVVLLQDGCAWLLARAGIKPRPFRSRLLMLLPLTLALYMFVWPIVYRFAVAPVIGHELRWPGWRLELTTTDFWQTFPGLLVAIPFLFVCGFLAVYLLGQKGYCTYGCPYGGFFAPLDELAPARIRVTDACEQCGHCTAVCTSNVRVHEEVRDFGMVVDQGCMKCLDCVKACPNDALYFGFGTPAIMAKSRAAELEPPASAPPAPRPAKRRFDLSWPEEIAVALLALYTFLAVRGIYGSVPLLFASGVTICVVWLTWKAWRTLIDRDVHLHGLKLRLKGRLLPAGWAMIAGAALLLALVVHSSIVNGARLMAERLDDRVTVPASLLFGPAPPQLPPEMAASAARAVQLYTLSSHLGDGGIGLGWGWQQGIDLRRAWLLATLHRWKGAELLLRGSLERHGDSEAAHAGLARILRAQLRHEESFEHVRRVLERRPEYIALFDETAAAMESFGSTAEAIALSRDALARQPAELNIKRRLSLLLSAHGDAAQLDEGIALIRETLTIEPSNPFAHLALAMALGRRGDLDEAEESLRRALELAPNNVTLNRALGEFLVGSARNEEAQPYLEKARQDAGK